LLFLILFFVGLMSATVTHAEIYTLTAKWGSSGTGNGQFHGPGGIAIDSSGNVYVADIGNHRIQKFSGDGTFIATWGFYGSNDGQFNSPESVAVDSSGNVYVPDSYNNRIQKFGSNGNFITKWGSPGSSDGQLSIPLYVAIDSKDNVYVTDLAANSGWAYPRVQKFTSDGTFISKLGSSGTGDGQFNSPNDIAVDSSDNVYVVDSGNHRIQKFGSNGNFITKWGSEGTGDGQFNGVNGIAIDSSGNVYVVDTGNHRIQKFGSNGNFITKWGSEGIDPEQFEAPWDVAVDSLGNAYVADDMNQRIQKFSKEKPTPTITWDNPADMAYETSLSSTQLNAMASIPGKLVYTPAVGTILSAGTQTLKVDFTPEDTTNSNAVSQTATINVLKTTPTITWNNPANITYGTQLSNTQLNAQASVSGNFNYIPSSGTILDVGTQKLSVDFTPKDTTNYTNASTNVMINVLQSIVPIFPGCTKPPTDPNHDGLFEDINGNERMDFADVVTYYNNMAWITQKSLTA
jgi:DNA-binding beta-propeller fold protein YncE